MDNYGKIKSLCEAVGLADGSEVLRMCDDLDCCVVGEHSSSILKIIDALTSKVIAIEAARDFALAILPAASLEADNAKLQKQNAEMIATIEMLKAEIEKLKVGNGAPAGLVETDEA